MKDVAIVGMACRFPGATTPSEYWSLLNSGDNAFIDVPKNRWDWNEFFFGHLNPANILNFQKAGFIDQLDQFDHAFFNMDHKDAERLDPQQKLALMATWEALENAGINPHKLNGTETAVIMGVAHSDHARKLKIDYPSYNGKIGEHSYECFVANRISYFLNLKGPSFTINSACSSSLHALYIAQQMLKSHEIDTAIVGGVNAILSVDESISSEMAGWLSARGVTASFADDGDGFVKSEGCGVVVLRRLEDAIEEGNPVLGLLKGIGLSHNGLSNGITAPSRKAQEDLIRKILTRSNLQAEDVTYVEAHGTGTTKGDSFEVTAIIGALSSAKEKTSTCYIGACKSSVGHLEAASGMAGLVKVLLSLKMKRLPAAGNIKRLNQWIKPSKTRKFEILTKPKKWKTYAKPRLAGLSNLSFGGANAFAFIEEYIPDPNDAYELYKTGRETPHTAQMMILSAKTLESLVLSLHKHASESLTQEYLYTLNARRAQHRFRLGCVGASISEIKNQVVAWAEDPNISKLAADCRSTLAKGISYIEMNQLVSACEAELIQFGQFDLAFGANVHTQRFFQNLIRSFSEPEDKVTALLNASIGSTVLRNVLWFFWKNYFEQIDVAVKAPDLTNFKINSQHSNSFKDLFENLDQDIARDQNTLNKNSDYSWDHMLLELLNKQFLCGQTINLATVFSGRVITVPNYQFEETNSWFQTSVLVQHKTENNNKKIKDFF
ncbi:MAG: hypothetical protein HRU28_00865 [Rhizobiales bacterium]|nr:hypothetical protein [Hyphomicrobiales bacterium]